MNADSFGASPSSPRSQEPQSRQADSLYQQSLQLYQDGLWEQAMAGFQEVLQLDPQNADAQALLEDTQLKASLETSKPKPRRGMPRLVRVLAIALAGLALLACGATSVYLVNQLYLVPQQRAERYAQQQAQLLADAQKAMANRDYATAESLYRTLLEQDPENPIAKTGIEQAQAIAALAGRYDRAKQAIASLDWAQAEALLTDILHEDPLYRDVQQQLLYVQEQMRLFEFLQQAEQYSASSDWDRAITAFESLRNLNTEYEKLKVTDGLFDSFLSQGAKLIEGTRGTTDAAQEAKALFQKALTLRPQDPRGVLQMSLVDRYLEAQARLSQGDKAGAQAALEALVKQQPDYAGGNAAALLQMLTGPMTTPTPSLPPAPSPMPTAAPVPIAPGASYLQHYADLVSRGDAGLTAGDYLLAEDMYQQSIWAAALCGQDSAKWLFVAHVKAGTANARNGQLATGVARIQTGIEIITKSAQAIPPESYSTYVAEAEAAVGRNDLRGALASYGQVVHVLSRKCHCGLEDWSILP